MDYICKIANLEEIEKRWDDNIKKHPNDNRWKIWKEETIREIKNNNKIAYYGILNNKIICEATATFKNTDSTNEEGLVGPKTVYLSAFRTDKEYQNKGYFSKLYKYLEQDLKNKGYKTLTLGVEPIETKNIKIYQKWGYTNFIKSQIESYPPKNKNEKPEEYLVNYYSKRI